MGLVTGKRCLGGMLELMLHCHHLVALDSAALGFPEVTLPVLPGMEGTHWPFRKARREDWPRLMELLLSGKPVRAAEAAGWLVDVAAPLEGALRAAWERASGEAGTAAARRTVEEGALPGVGEALSAPGEIGEVNADAARGALHAAVVAACSAPLADALELQSQVGLVHDGEGVSGGVVGSAAARMA